MSLTPHSSMPHERALFENTSEKVSSPRSGSIQRVVNIGSWEHDLTTGQMYWSAEARAIVGIAEHEAWTLQEYIAQIVHSFDRERLREAIQHGIEHSTGFESEHRILVAQPRFTHEQTTDTRAVQAYTIEKTVLVSCIMSESLNETVSELSSSNNGTQKRLHGTIQDMSALRATHSELDTQRFLLRESQAIAKIGGWEYDVAAQRLFWTEEYYHLICRTPEEYPASIDNYYAFVHPHDRQRVYDDMQAALQGQSDALEYRIVLPDDTIRHIRGYGAVLRDAEGNISKLRGVIQDITDNKRSEQKLQRLTNVLNQAQHLTNLGSWELDLRSDELTWSDEFFRQLGYEPQQFQPEVGSFLQHVHPDDRRIVKDGLALLQRNTVETLEQSPFIDYRLIRSDGTTRYMRGTGGNIVNSLGKVIVMFGTLQDITFLKEAQQRLEASERKFRQLFEQSTLGKLILTSALQPREANTAFLELLEYSYEELSTKPYQELLHEDERQRFTELLQALLLGNIPLLQTDTRLRTKTGNTRWCRVQASIFEQHHDILERNVLMTAEDITQYRQVEAAIQKTMQRERDTFDQRNQIIARLTQQLQTPLSTISLASNIMHKYHFKMPEEKITSYFGNISEAIEEIQSLMSNMVLMAKLETGRAQLQLAPLNFTSFSKRLLSEFTSKYSHRPIDATFNLPENTPALIDHELLRLIVWHLLLFLDKGLAKGMFIQCRIEGTFASGTQLPKSITWHFSCTGSRYENIATLLQDSEHTAGDSSEVGLYTIQQAVKLHGAYLTGKNAETALQLVLPLPS